MSTETKKAEKLFKEIEQFIADSQNLLEEDSILELSELDGKVKILCEEVLSLSQDERIKYSEELQKLFNDLTKLGESLTAHRDGLASSIVDMGEHKKAASAYHSAKSIKSSSGNDEPADEDSQG